VKWWTETKVFDIKNDVFFKISDEVDKIKKKMEQERKNNREVAKTMTAGKFKEWHKQQQEQGQED